MKIPSLLCLLLLAAGPVATALTINADFSRDVVNGTNPGNNPSPVLYNGAGPAGGAGTLWNDLQVPLAATGDAGANTILHPVVFPDLIASDGTPTSVGIRLVSGFTAAFNSGAALSSVPAALQNDRVFPSAGALATLRIEGLDPLKFYNLHCIGAASFSTAFTIQGVTRTASGNPYDGTWTEGGEFASFNALKPNAAGEITMTVQDGTAPIDSFGVLGALQITEQPINFLYAAGATSTGGQFSSAYPPTNLMNAGFTSQADTINTTGDYAAGGNSYATVSGTTKNFNLTFDFAGPSDIDGMHVWNYVYRNGATGGTNSPTSGVNSYTLTFYDGAAGAGAAVGAVYSGNLTPALFDALNPAQSVYFGSTYRNVRSVVLRVLSNHGAASFTGLNELAFNGTGATSAGISSFTASAPFVQRPATPTLSWTITGAVTSLSISPAIGDVLPLTTDGSGSIAVSPLGEQTYTLTLNGGIQKTLSVVGLPVREKVHLYLLIGQSNIQGAGTPFNATLDAPDPRVLKFGSRNGMEPVFVKGGHNLTFLETTNSNVGMGVEFGKTMLASQSDPEVVIGLINHAIGSSAIQWWAPGVVDSNQINPVTGQNYHLYDEAVQRVNDASNYGVLKGVLWHQGEYNSGTNTSPPSDPNGYAARLQDLVTNLRTTFSKPGLPFVCGKFVPATWTNADGSPGAFGGLPNRATVEAALADLPNQRANTFCVDNDGLRGRSDQLIHFDAYSQRLLGQRYAAAMAGFYADPFRLFLGGYLTPAQLADPQTSAPGADLDQDGYSNFLEYAFLSDPTRSEPVIPISYSTVNVPGNGDFPAIQFRMRTDPEAPDYVVEVSSDLATWTSNVAGQPPVTATVGTPAANTDGTVTATVRDVLPLGGNPGHRFLRVRAVR